MTPQTPAKGVLIRHDWGDAMMFQVVCDCGQSGHDHHVWIEAEQDTVEVTIHTNVKSRWWEIKRWQQIWQLLTRGYLEMESSVSMDRQAALNYAETLRAAVHSVEQHKNDNGS